MRADESPSNEKGQPGIAQAALSGMCPRCKEPTLFEAPARVALKCESCGLDYTKLERGGRIAGLVTSLVAVLLMMLAIGADMAFKPPFWVQVVFWAPVTVLTVIGVLRFYKTALLYRQYEIQTRKNES